jgi:hypothetical protein
MNEEVERKLYEDWLHQSPEFADTIISAWDVWLGRAALSAPAVPEGWKLVPIEPTPEMMAAAVQEICYGPEGGFTRIAGPSRAWRVMLAAAPSPQEQTP